MGVLPQRKILASLLLLIGSFFDQTVAFSSSEAGAFRFSSTHRIRIVRSHFRFQRQTSVPPSHDRWRLEVLQLARSSSSSSSSSSTNSKTEDHSRCSAAGDNCRSLLPLALRLTKASLLIAGTTVGGGFLALPQTVVVPLGFPVAAAALCLAWLFLLALAWHLCDSLVACYNNNTNNTNHGGGGEGIGIVHVVQQLLLFAVGKEGDRPSNYTRFVRMLQPQLVALVLLVLLTQATLVSQLARAGILLSSSSFLGAAGTTASSNNNCLYPVGCATAALVGAVLSFAGSRGDQDTTTVAQQDARCKIEVDDDGSDKSLKETTTTTTLATTSNAVLTVVFIGAATMLFVAGKSSADWSRCLVAPTNASTLSAANSVLSLSSSLLEAAPTMLQLLVYGEILPQVCRVLQYKADHIRLALVVGSAIPLVLLVGWAALGVALLPPGVPSSAVLGSTAAPMVVVDPVQVLLSSGGGAVQNRLYVLAVSAILTTILGSYLALESAYTDMMPGGSSPLHPPARPSMAAPAFKRAWSRHPWTKVLAIVGPPLAIACSSPSLFLGAIDFAGAYPVLLLYGVICPLAYLRNKKSKMLSFLCLVSCAMVAANLFNDLQFGVLWLLSKLT